MREHPFFRKSRGEQKRFQFGLALAALLVLLLCAGLLDSIGLLPLIAVVIAIVLSIVAPFFDVPGLVRSGKLRYYSPFLLAEPERDGAMVLHAGTLFDFWFLFPRTMPAGERRRLALSGMIDGLLRLIEDDENSDRSHVTVRVTSYILNQRTAAKLGFHKRSTDGLQTLLIYFNYFNLVASYSLLHRRLRVPRIRSVQTFEGSLDQLGAQRSRLETLRDRLRR